MNKLRKFISILLIVAMVLPFVTQLRAEDSIDNPEVLSEVIEENSDIEDITNLNEEELSKDKEEDFQEELSENETNKIEEVNSNNIQLYSNNNDNTEVAEKRIAVALLLDVSYSMQFNQEKPFIAMKKAAKEFCRTILEKNPDVQISLIRQYGSSQVVRFEGSRSWSNNIDELEKTIDGIRYGNSTGIESAFNVADNLLDKIDADQKVIINMSDGAPNTGTQIENGALFTKEDIDNESSGDARSYMRYANGVQAYVNKIENKYQIFSIGFFHGDPEKKNKDTQIGTKLMEKAHNSGYYDATNDVELSNAYAKIAEIVESPVSMIIEIEELSQNNGFAKYKIKVKLVNNNSSKGVIIQDSTVKISVPEAGNVIGESEKQIDSLSHSEFLDFYVSINKTEFPNGGRFEFSVEFSNRILGSFRQKSTIPIINNKDEFIFGEDHWSFQNFGNELILEDNELKAFYDSLSPVDRSVIHRISRIKKINGHCYGMSVTSIFNQGKLLGSETFGYKDGENLYNVEKNDKSIKTIQFYHLQQFLNKVQNNFDNTGSDFVNDSKTVLMQLKENIINKSKKGNLLPLVVFDWDYYDEEDNCHRVAHAVVATSIEKGEFYCSNTMKRYENKVQFYDPNFPKLDEGSRNYENSYLLFNESDGTWSIPAYEISSEDNKMYPDSSVITSITNNKDEMALIDMSTSLYNYKARIEFASNLKNKKWKLNNSKKSWILDLTEKILYKDLMVRSSIDFNPSYSGQSDMIITLPNNNTIYELSAEDNRQVEFNNSITFGEKFLSGETKEAKKLIFDPSGSVEIVGNKGEFLITIADNETKDGTFNVYTIEGSGEGDLKAVKTDEGLKLYGKYTSGTITFEDEHGVVGKKDIEVNKGVVEYKKQANTLNVSDEERGYSITVTKSDKVSSYNITEANGTDGKYKDGTEVVIKDVVCQDSFKPLVKIKVKGIERILEDENGEYKFTLTDNTEVIITTDTDKNEDDSDSGNPVPQPGLEDSEKDYGHYYEPDTDYKINNSDSSYKPSVAKKEEKKEELKPEEAYEFKTLYFYLDKPYYETLIDGTVHQIPMDVQPTAINERTMLPIRFVAEAIGATVEWHQDTQSATFTKDGITATITLGNPVITVSDGRTIQMDAEPTVISERIFVPLTNISQIFGLTNGDLRDGVDNDIEWDQDNYRVIIKIKK